MSQHVGTKKNTDGSVKKPNRLHFSNLIIPNAIIATSKRSNMSLNLFTAYYFLSFFCFPSIPKRYEKLTPKRVALSRTQMDTFSTTGANVFLFLIIIGFIITGIRKKINVYDAFVEGAKEGFTTAVRIIPYLVAILVGIGVFRASGAMDYLIGGIEYVVNLCGIDSEWVGLYTK